jgi:hypothetical protein
MSALKNTEEEKRTPIERYRDQIQQTYMVEIDELVNKLADSENSAVSTLLENRLKVLSRKVEASGTVKDFSMDGVMERVRRERVKRQRIASASGARDPEATAYYNVRDMISNAQRNFYRGGTSFGSYFR